MRTTASSVLTIALALHALADTASAAKAAAPAPSQNLLATFEQKLTEHRLANGWRFLIVEQHDAPVASFVTHVDVGSAQERYGITGLAHMFEHMAFKGTSRIATRDARTEAAAIDRLDVAFVALKAERQKLGGGDPARLQELERAFKDAEAEAARHVVENEFGEIIERQGGVGLNASTSNDETTYYLSFPANKVELWAYLESERFLDPVFRDFYKERDVVKEERRMRTESQPIGRLVEEFLAAAFKAHPYGHPVVGHMSDLDAFTIADAKEFYRQHYVPANMTTAIVGAVKPAELIPILDAYFGRIPAGAEPEPLRTVEPEQTAERRVTLVDAAQPFWLEGYHIPGENHPDTPALDAVAEVLGTGRTSRLYRDLVRDQKIAAQVQVFRGFPGTKYPTLFGVLAVPTPGHKAAEMGVEVAKHIERLRTEPVTAAELAQVKSRAKANLVRQLATRTGLAVQLAGYEALTGDWRNLFRDVERLDRLTPEDLQRVVNAWFRPTKRTVASIVNEPSEL